MSIVVAIISGITSIIVAIIGYGTSKAQKQMEAQHKLNEKRDKMRAEEAKLQLQMLAANSQLTIGVAMALKNGHCNGEVEQGLKDVEAAKRAYNKFMRDSFIDTINA